MATSQKMEWGRFPNEKLSQGLNPGLSGKALFCISLAAVMFIAGVWLLLDLKMNHPEVAIIFIFGGGMALYSQYKNLIGPNLKSLGLRITADGLVISYSYRLSFSGGNFEETQFVPWSNLRRTEVNIDEGISYVCIEFIEPLKYARGLVDSLHFDDLTFALESKEVVKLINLAKADHLTSRESMGP